MNKKLGLMVGALFGLTVAQSVMAADCAHIGITYDQLRSAANSAAASDTGGYGLPMWVTLVDENGTVCQVVSSAPATTGAGAGYWSSTNGSAANDGSDANRSQWLGSRVISAQKANTANAFSVDGYAISTANLYSAVQPGGSLYGLQHSNPVDASRAYGGSPNSYGTKSDYLRNKRIGGVNVFGGGLALYDGIRKVGAIGVSGDTSCRDHSFAWLVRQNLGLEPSGNLGITNFNAPIGGTDNFINFDGGANPFGLDAVGDEMIVNTSAPWNTLNGHVDGTDITGAVTAYWRSWSHPGCPNLNTNYGVKALSLGYPD